MRSDAELMRAACKDAVGFGEGLAYDDVAAGPGTTPAAARVRVARGLGQLRHRLLGTEREAV
jgi:DNA-directed RNA polymerase specialized sigma24 family protein